MRLRLEVTGAKEAAAALRAQAVVPAEKLGAVLDALAGHLVTVWQGHIRRAEGPDGPWPALKPATRAIRRWYGHPADEPRLIRSGDFPNSIRLLSRDRSSLRVGTDMAIARVLDKGGTWTDDAGTREVQAFPFDYLTDTEREELVGIVEDLLVVA